MISLNDVLLAASNIPVDDPIAEIWGRGLQGGYKIIEYTGSLPITITANGDALFDYRIYGADGGVGVITENLLDPNAKNVDNGYIDNSVISSIEDCITHNIKWAYVTEYIPVDGNTECIMFMNLYRASTDYATGIAFYDENKNFISSIKGCIAFQEVTYENPRLGMKSFTTPGNCRYIRTNVDKLATMLMLVAASTPPPAYIPYGYKLPMVTRSENLFDPNDPGIERGYYYGYNNGISTAYGENSWESGWIPVTPGDYTFYLKRVHVGFYFYVNFYNSQKEFVNTIVSVTNPNGFYTRTISDVGYVRFNGINVYSTDWLVARGNVTKYTPYSRTDTPVYIGENQLDAGEYVSFSEQKIYRDVGGTLTPTDPPVPLPDIPTIDGTTVIDYDGDPKPSQMYVKYKG